MSKGHRKSVLFSFSVGIVAGLVSMAILIMIKVFAGGLSLPELASQTLFSLTPGEFESQAIETFGPLAKYSTFIGSIIVTIIILGIFGILSDKLYHKFNLNRYILKAISSFALTFGILVIISIIFVTIIQVRSGSQTISIQPIILSLIPSQIAYGLILPLFLRKPKDKVEEQKPYSKQQQTIIENTKEEKEEEEENKNYSRSDFIRLILTSIVSIPIIYFGLNRLFSPQAVEQQQQQQQFQSDMSKLLPQPQQSGSIPAEFKDPALAPLLASEITPTYLFYRIDINPIVPEIDVNSWNLQIKGMVDNPLKLTYDEIRSMPAIEEFVTLECISNKIGGDLIGTALWKGVRLKDILEKAKIVPSVKYIVFRCSDGYDVGVPLDKGLMDETIIAYEMNLAPLTSKHGFPVRAIVPGLYGMMNPKWITEIELVDKVYEGYWQRNGWTNIANYNTGSSIVIPGQAPIRHRFRGLDEIPLSTSNERVPIAGIAFGGDRGISKVEVSTDGGKTWKTAKIKEPFSQYTWVLWTGGFIPKEGIDNYKIVVRATDKKGKIQTSEVRKPFPDGATGYHTISI
ncbi:MAG TPA: molybdopterin-dependent oxidoreductase [Nitrososphaeraceae archaeon]|nr:molybdopterin-dependent oxidoreductase [Nitrososphaeraceae archaeon]